ncbi:hypothetical protein N7373_15085 [Achromobacter mucicolens]|uniref:hypothetical protein n=1 Tax=Achromobacter mucicolens TaxID=1389922 RepID=UPI0024488A5D|nr:hypothetical protein [Achromobacter mucicolens]MDH0092775.1 hypothetical protein [Achromobacter mucicolens]
MRISTQHDPGLAGSIQRLNALAAAALSQYHAEIQAGGEPPYPAWVDDVAAVADEFARASAGGEETKSDKGEKNV